MSLSAEQLTDFRADLGDQTQPYAFTDLELERLYERAGSYNGAKLLAIDQLIMNAAKFYNYKAGYTQQDEAEVFKNLVRVREILQTQGNGFLQAGISIIPPKHKDEPRA